MKERALNCLVRWVCVICLASWACHVLTVWTRKTVLPVTRCSLQKNPRPQQTTNGKLLCAEEHERIYLFIYLFIYFWLLGFAQDTHTHTHTLSQAVFCWVREAICHTAIMARQGRAAWYNQRWIKTWENSECLAPLESYHVLQCLSSPTDVSRCPEKSLKCAFYSFLTRTAGKFDMQYYVLIQSCL